MNKLKNAIIALLMLMAVGVSINSNAQTPDIPYQANWESLSRYQCPEWYKDAKGVKLNALKMSEPGG